MKHPLNINSFSEQDCNWHELSENPNITTEFVKHFIDKPWNWGKHGLSKHLNITIEFVRDNIDENWEWGQFGLSENPN